MTCIEKLKAEFPDWSEEDIECEIHEACPADKYIAPDPAWCLKKMDCRKCWEREVPASESDNHYKFEGQLTGETMRRLERLRDKLEKDPEDVIEAALLLYEDALDAVDKGSERWTEMYIVGESRG